MSMLLAIRSYALCLVGVVACADADAANLLVNGDFATGYSGWTITNSDPARNIVYWTPPGGTPPSQGSTTGGSLNLTAMSSSSISASQCVAIDTTAIDASVLIYPLVTAGPSTPQVVAFDASDCSGDPLAVVALTPAAPVLVTQWNDYRATTSLPVGTQGLRFALTVSDGANNSDGDYLFDNAQLESLTIFGDGFESGTVP